MARQTRRILVIDDEPVDRETYARFFALDPLYRYEIVEAETGREGLELLADQQVDCVVLDYNLPDTDGLGVLDDLKATRDRQIPIVMLTGAGSEAIAVETMKRGCQDYVVKGETSALGLRQAVDNAIEKVRLRQEIEERRSDLEASQRQQIELKNRFLSHVSHELRTPLTAVHQFLSLCLDGLAGELNETQNEYLQIAQRNVDQLKKMISDLMEVTRAEAGKLRVELSPLETGKLLEECVRTHRSPAGDKQISLEIEPEAALPTVLADESRIRQVLANLLENAIKFTPEGGSIRVSARLDPGEGSACVRISVRDTGRGISEPAREKIFSRLHQENPDSDETRKGLGLGLAICKELICLQGGRIWVESEEGAGSTFHFTLPEFSLARLVAPALMKEDRVRSSYAVLRISLVPGDQKGQGPVSEDLSRSLHHLLGKLVYYPSDVVLPRLWKPEDADIHYVVAATGAEGLKAMLPRLRRHLEAHVAARAPHVALRLDGRAEETEERDRQGPPEMAVANAARRIEELIRDPGAWGE